MAPLKPLYYFLFQSTLNPMAMDYLMDVVEPKTFFGIWWDWVTNNVDRYIKVCTSAIINGWKYCKNKTKEAFTCCPISASDEADRCVYFSFFSNSKSFMIFCVNAVNVCILFLVNPFHFGISLFLLQQQVGD